MCIEIFQYSIQYPYFLFASQFEPNTINISFATLNDWMMLLFLVAQAELPGEPLTRYDHWEPKPKGQTCRERDLSNPTVPSH